MNDPNETKLRLLSGCKNIHLFKCELGYTEFLLLKAVGFPTLYDCIYAGTSFKIISAKLENCNDFFS